MTSPIFGIQTKTQRTDLQSRKRLTETEDTLGVAQQGKGVGEGLRVWGLQMQTAIYVWMGNEVLLCGQGSMFNAL